MGDFLPFPEGDIKFEIVELTFNQYGLWCNTTRVDSYQYPMGLEVWGGNGFYKKVGELKTHQQILNEWTTTAPSEFAGLLDQGTTTIHFPTKSSSFPQSLIQNYIDQIWSKYSSQQLVFNSGDAGTWRGSVSGSSFVFTRDSDGQVATIPGKPTTEMAMEASGVMAQGAQWDLVVQAQIAAAINRHAINLNLGSGVMQDFSIESNYYQTWPYNWYAKFWHRPDISFDSQTYAFSFDDVFDQSATIHTPSPASIKITIGGFPGGNSGAVATLFQHCNYGGYSATLSEGSYNLGQLQSLGVANDDISSIQIQNGYQMTMYQHHNFTGNSIIKTGDDACLVDDGFNDDISSLVISPISSGWSQQIEAEDFTVQSGIQTETCSEGGLNVGWIDANDWVVWDVNIPSSGRYTVEYRVASPNGTGNMQLENAGGNPVYGARTVPNTSGWQNWTTVSHTVSLNAGQQQIAIKALSGGWNLNWLKISSASGSRTGDAGEIASLQQPEISLYPNPVHTTLKLKGLDQGGHFEIFNLGGQLVMNGMLEVHENQSEITVDELTNGTYIIKLIDTEKSFRFIKQ